MQLAEENWKSIKRNHPQMAETLQREMKKRREDVWTEEFQNGEKVIAIERSGRIWHLNSRINPSKAAKIYSERYPSRIYLTYFVYGFGDGKHIRSLLEQCDETNQIIVLEPDCNIFMEAMNQFPIIDLIEDERVTIVLLEFYNDIENLVNEKVTTSRAELVEFCILPGYDVLYPDKCKSIIEKIPETIHSIISNDVTIMAFHREFARRRLYNMKKMISENNIAQIVDEAKKIDKKLVPAIIVSAGPSLDKNVAELCNAKGRSCIIAVDAALRTLINMGIKPDLAVTIDARVPNKFFEGLDLSGMNWMCMHHTRTELIEQNSDTKIFYDGSFTARWKEAVEQELGYQIPKIVTGGCVSSVAFMLAIYCGFETIILVGQDLAFTDGKSHTVGALNVFGDDNKYIESRERTMVEGINGEMLETDVQMYMYKNWFEMTIEQIKDKILVINATEGGAKIQGTENKILRDAIREYCQGEIDFYKLIHEIEPPIDQKGKERLYKKIIDMKDDMNALKEKLSHTIEKIKKMQKEFESKKGGLKKKKSILMSLKKINEEIEQEEMLEWLQLYSAEEEHELLENIYKDENIKEEELIEKSLRLYELYYKKTEMFFEDFEAYAV